MGCGASHHRRPRHRSRRPAADGERRVPMSPAEKELHATIDAQRHRSPSIAQSAKEPSELLESVRRRYLRTMAQIRDPNTDGVTPAACDVSDQTLERIVAWLEDVERLTDHEFPPVVDIVVRRSTLDHSHVSHSEASSMTGDPRATRLRDEAPDSDTELGEGQSVAAASSFSRSAFSTSRSPVPGGSTRGPNRSPPLAASSLLASRRMISDGAEAPLVDAHSE